MKTRLELSKKGVLAVSLASDSFFTALVESMLEESALPRRSAAQYYPFSLTIAGLEI
jgi:hypothetical protein